MPQQRMTSGQVWSTLLWAAMVTIAGGPNMEAREFLKASQLTPGSEPVQPGLDAQIQLFAVAEPKQISLLPDFPPTLASAIARQEGKAEIRRRMIGLRRALEQKIEINAATIQAGDWTIASNGWRVLSIQIGSSKACGIRLHLENVHLPTGARLILSAPAQTVTEDTVIRAEDFAETTELWAPTVFSELVGMECLVPPASSTSDVALTIAEISHLYELPARSLALKEGGCENDVSCAPDYQEAASGVALISYVHNGNTFLCTGCLLGVTNAKAGDYFLTARHCIGNSALAATLEFFWLFQTPGCGASPPAIADVPHTTGGASLLAIGVSDFAFMKLKKTPPTNAAPLGWSVARPSTDETLATVHHPDGTFKRISFGAFIDSDIYNWAVRWSSGVTESGSSGSPLLNGAKQVIGQLTGGFNGAGSSCDNPGAPDEFGRFDVTYPYIKKWIDPSGSAGGPPPVAGTFSGLFYDQAFGVAPQTSGSFSLSTTAKGKVTGKLMMQRGTYSLSGQLDIRGGLTVSIKRKRQAPLGVQFRINLESGADVVNGLVSDGDWTAVMYGERAVFDGKTNSCPQAGRYTLVIPPGTGVGQSPEGLGFGAVLVMKNGRLSFSGSLPDGTKLSQSSCVSRSGLWPLFLAVTGGQASLFSWISFADGNAGDLSGQITWNDSRVGFLTTASVTGSNYHPPGKGQTILNVGSATISLTGAGLDQAIQGEINFKQNGSVSSAGLKHFALNFIPSTGIFSGAVQDPTTKQVVAIQGVALQKQKEAAGYFTIGASNTVSGAVVIHP